VFIWLVLSGENYGKGRQISAKPIIQKVETRQEIEFKGNSPSQISVEVKPIGLILLLPYLLLQIFGEANNTTFYIATITT